MRAQRCIHEKEIKRAITYMTEDELLSYIEIRDFVTDFYGGQFFVPFEMIDKILTRMVNNRWEYLNCIHVNGLSFFWFDDNAYRAMQTSQKRKMEVNAICKKVYYYRAG